MEEKLDKEIARATAFALEELKELNDRLGSKGGTSVTPTERGMKPDLQTAKYTELVADLSAMLDAVDQLHAGLNGRL